MSHRKELLGIVAAIAILLVALSGLPSGASSAQAQPAARSVDPTGTTLPYSGHLSLASPGAAFESGEAGQPVAAGLYDFTFSLYAAASGGQPLWSEVQAGVSVQNGQFSTSLGRSQPIPRELLLGSPPWLAVAVRGPGETGFTLLAPRQHLSAAAPAAKVGAACPHDHFGESWEGTATGSWAGLEVVNNQADGVGLNGIANSGEIAIGVRGESTLGVGVEGRSVSDNGVYAYSWGSGSQNAALRAENPNSADGIAAYFSNSSPFPTCEFDQAGVGRVLDLQNNGTGNGDGSGDFIAAFGQGDPVPLRFRVGGRGDVWAADGYYLIPKDMAEMFPAADGLEPGDVLVIGLDGKLARCTEAYQASVVGVYSTRPGIVAGVFQDGAPDGTVPLAVVGVVPVKVSAENGSIRPGDLLVASATPGYAMRAGPNPPQGTVIGKALEPLAASTGTGVIQMLATLQ